ncbi:MAG: hypothetical protein Fur0021_23890 [Candidatus Promineifilaceae bacterium]
MNPHHNYRLKLAHGFLRELRQDISLERWRSAMDNAQLTVNNTAKSILALFAPVGRTHNPTPLLRQLTIEKPLPYLPIDKVMRLAEIAAFSGPDLHIQTHYGNETKRSTPWNLFDEEDARQALTLAEEAVTLAQTIAQKLTEGGNA